MLKIRYIGTRPLMMPDGTYIFNDEKRVISKEHADVLEPSKDLFEVLGFEPDAHVVEQVEEAEPVEEVKPVVQNESEALAKIAAAKTIADLYAVMDEYPDRSQLVEDEINAKGNELMDAEKIQNDSASSDSAEGVG